VDTVLGNEAAAAAASPSVLSANTSSLLVGLPHIASAGTWNTATCLGTADVLLLPDGQIVVFEDVNTVVGSEDASVPASLIPPGGTALASESSGLLQSLAVPALTLQRIDGAAPKARGVVRVLEPQDKDTRETRQVSKASSAHLVLASHAITLATLQGVSKGDMTHVREDAVKNAASVTPVGAFIVQQLLHSKQDASCAFPKSATKGALSSSDATPSPVHRGSGHLSDVSLSPSSQLPSPVHDGAANM